MSPSSFGNTFDLWVVATDAYNCELNKVTADPRREKTLLAELAKNLCEFSLQFGRPSFYAGGTI